MSGGNHSQAEVARQVSRERTRPVVEPVRFDPQKGAPIIYRSGDSLIEFADKLEKADATAEEFEHVMGAAIEAYDRWRDAGGVGAPAVPRGKREVFESPTWKREGTQAYFTEAKAAGYPEIDRRTGEAYRLVLPEPPVKPATKAERKTLRVLVRAHLPHVAELTSGEHGPKVNMVYGFDWWTDRKSDTRFPQVGDKVLCPPTPRGPQVPFEASVMSINQATCNAKYSGPVKNIIKIIEEEEKS